jgi:hypothetical protein
MQPLNLDRMLVWSFTRAPRELQTLHSGPVSPDWLVLVPRGLGGPDLEDVISGTMESASIARYETDLGDIVYTGRSRGGAVAGILAAQMREPTQAMRRVARRPQ